MFSFTVSTQRSTSEVVVGHGLVEKLPALIADLGLRPPKAVVSNTTVAPLYGRHMAHVLAAGQCVELPDGEQFKRWPQVEALCLEWMQCGLHRSDSVAAVGGGVVTDTAGFAASVFLRGVAWIAVPTTLLAMVDASVGGKTGVNLEVGKNLVGTFWHPRLVVADLDTLATLPQRELQAGLAEVVKSAWIGDRGILELIQLGDRPAGDRWEELVTRSIRVKARIVEADEREAGQRKALNLGHTLGHAFEAATGYRRFLHGEAVAWGLLAVTRISRSRGLLSPDEATRLSSAVNRLGLLPPISDVSCDRLLGFLSKDKKRDDLGVGWVLPTDDGVVLDQRLETAEVRAAIEYLHTLCPIRI